MFAVALCCITYVESANILGVFVLPAISHQIVFQSIYRQLSLRGHQVTVVTPNPLNDPTLTNLTEISVSFVHDTYNTHNNIEEVLGKDNTMFEITAAAYEIEYNFLKLELNSIQFRQLIADQSKHFDLILTECLSPALYALAERYKTPVIGVCSMGALTAENDIVGNPIFPILNPDIFLNVNFVKLSLWDKVRSVVLSLWARYHHRWVVQPKAHELAKKHFGEDIKYVGDVEKKQSLLFINTNPVIYSPSPKISSIVEMGFTHFRPSRSLPQDLQEILDEAVEGVVYFSLGCHVKSVHISETLKRTITETMAGLPYKVLWKWETDHFPGKPENVVIRKWLPQQDILGWCLKKYKMDKMTGFVAHPNVKVFVTQGGLQSVEEAITRKVPIVGMPFMADQPMNVQKVVDWGIGLGVDPATLTKDELNRSIVEVAENNKYKNRIEEVCQLVYDRPMSGVEKAVWWSEYVIRHKGARHLRSPTADVSWFEYLMVDVVNAVLVMSIVTVWIAYQIV